jgi:hypothetical protein
MNATDGVSAETLRELREEYGPRVDGMMNPNGDPDVLAVIDELEQLRRDLQALFDRDVEAAVERRGAM